MHTEGHRTEEHRIKILHGNEESNHDGNSYGDESSEEGSAQKIIKWIVVAGVLIVLLIASIGIVKLVPKVLSKLSTASVFLGNDKESTDLTIKSNPASVRSENIFYVNWESKEYDTEVVRSVSFKCVSGINIEYKSTSGMRPVVCDTVFPLPKEKVGSFPFTVTSLLNKKVALDYVVAVTETLENKVLTSASGSVDVYPKGAGETESNNLYSPDYSNPTPTDTNKIATSTGEVPTKITNTNTTTTPYPTTYRGTTETGQSNLQVILTNISVIDSYTGNAKSTTNISRNDRITTRFRVSNIGTRSSGIWILKANIPSLNSSERIYTSSYQPSLTPGSVYEMVLSFDSYDGNGDLSITASNTNDQNYSNNTITIPLEGNGSSTNTGRADLTVRIEEVGVTNGNGGSIYYTNNFDESDTIAVRFTIENRGGDDSGRFSFSAELPSKDNDTFNSPTYSSLAPGEQRQFTLAIDNPDSGRSRIKIEVDEENDVRESNENNNTDSETIDIDN